MTVNATLRDATAADLPAIDALYNHYVLHSLCTMQTVPDAPEVRQAWFARQGQANLPTLIAECDGRVVGWAALFPYSPRQGYRFTVEDSVYLHPDFQGRGVGRLLLTELLARGKARGLHNVIAKITSSQPASIALHTRLGFTEFGRMRDAGIKHGTWLDVVLMQVLLGPRFQPSDEP